MISPAGISVQALRQVQLEKLRTQSQASIFASGLRVEGCAADWPDEGFICE